VALNREAIFAALLARLTAGITSAGITLNTAPSRSFRDVDQVAADAQPAVFILQAQETPQFAPQGHQMPPRWLLLPRVYAYARTNQETGAPPSSTLNPIVTAIEAALEYQSGDGAGLPKGATTLGKLCTYCRIASVEYGEGLVDDPQGVVIIHLEILAMGDA
jgi:hypothetical protein